MEPINKSNLMKNAWVRARNLVFMNGGTAKEWFAFALRERWAFEKSLRAPKQAPVTRVEATTQVKSIKNWFIDKNFDLQDFKAYSTRESIETLEETEKAVRIKIIGSYGKKMITWLPKSCIEA